MLTAQDRKKLGKAQSAALEALKQAGAKGLDTWELIKVAGTRGPARTHELKKLGHVIKVERVHGDRLLFRYVYLGFSDSNQLTLFQAA